MKLLKKLLGRSREQEYLSRAAEGIKSLRHDDIFLVGYPKSGNTWVRFLIGNYLSNGKCDFENSHLLVPGLVEHPDICNELSSVRFMSTHFTFSTFRKFLKKFSYKDKANVVFIARDGRDVMVSYFYHLKKNRKIEGELSLDKFISLLNSGQFNPFQSWGNYITDWVGSSIDNVNFKVVLYKDLIADTRGTLRDILEFSGIVPEKDRLELAIQRSDFGRMRNLEQVQSSKHDRLKNTDSELFFVRKGKPGNWQDEFDDVAIHEFNLVNERGLKMLGYV